MVGFSLLNLYVVGPLIYGGLRDEIDRRVDPVARAVRIVAKRQAA
jgi:hypothetical protein